MSSTELFQIDLHKIFQTKATGMAKKTPRFIVNFLAWIIRQKGINDFLKINNNATGVEFMQNAVDYFDIKIQLKGEENIPQIPGQRFIFASNHPLGGLDGICLSAVLGQKYDKHIQYLVNDILYFIKPLQNIFVPVNKHGAQAKRNIQLINDAFLSDNQIITFPAGLCSRKINGKIMDSDWKKAFIVKAVESQRNIIPVFFKAQNSTFFYWISNFRKKLGIKINIEMLLLPREMFKNKGNTFTIYFGKPVSRESLDSSKSPLEWAEVIKKQVYQMDNN